MADLLVDVIEVPLGSSLVDCFHHNRHFRSETKFRLPRTEVASSPGTAEGEGLVGL